MGSLEQRHIFTAITDIACARVCVYVCTRARAQKAFHFNTYWMRYVYCRYHPHTPFFSIFLSFSSLSFSFYVHLCKCCRLSNMKIKSNQIIYYASYSYANDKKFNLVLIVPMCVCVGAHVCVCMHISSSSATVTTRHQYYCHCSFRSLSVQNKQPNDWMK